MPAKNVPKKKEKLSLTKLIREHVEKRGQDGEIRADLIVKKLLRLAESGEQWAIKEVMDRMEGKAIARAQIDHTSQGESLGASISFTPKTSLESPSIDALPEGATEAKIE